jgi:hypothetical protein
MSRRSLAERGLLRMKIRDCIFRETHYDSFTTIGYDIAIYHTLDAYQNSSTCANPRGNNIDISTAL